VNVWLGLRGRLVAAVTAVSLASLGAAFGIVSLVFANVQERQLDRALLSVADEEVRALTRDRGDTPVVRDRPGPAANDVGPLPLYAALYDWKGALLSATETFGGAPPAFADLASGRAACFDLLTGPQPLRATVISLTLPSTSGSRSVRLLVAAPRSDLDGDASLLRRAMIVVFCVAVAWTVALALWVIGRLTRHHRAIVATALRVASGDLSARVGIVGSDEVARLGHTIDEMIDRLALLLRSQQQFIAHAAHELRSPLTTLYGELTNALRKSRGIDEYRAAIDAALDSTRRLKNLTEDLLSLARLGAEPARAEVNAPLDGAIDEALQSIEAERRAKDVRVVARPLATTVVGRAADLTRMFRNLLENGVRHSPAGEEVSIEAQVRGPNVEIHVTDKGSGVAAEDRDRVFEPFYRGSRVRGASIPGAGLGLSIARDIARLYGGDIVIDEHQSTGAHFVVTLPLAPGA